MLGAVHWSWKRIALIAGIIIAAAGAFIGVVGPLFWTSGAPRAELSGLFDTVTLTVGKEGSLPIAVDNTGDSIIDPLCIGVKFSHPVTTAYGVFDNSYRYAISDGRVCGGSLVGQETINVAIVVRSDQPGALDVVLTPMQGAKSVGRPISASVNVSTP